MKVYVILQDSEDDGPSISGVFINQGAAIAHVNEFVSTAWGDELGITEWREEDGVMFLYDTERFRWYWAIETHELNEAAQ